MWQLYIQKISSDLTIYSKTKKACTKSKNVHAFLEYVINIRNYTRVTLPDFKARAETHTRFGLPSTRMRTF